MRKNKRRNNFLAVILRRRVLINAGCLVVFAGLSFLLVAGLKKAECFRVRQVVIREKDDVTSGEAAFAYLKGKNIFSINLKLEEERIARSYPSFRKIRLTRLPPDCVVVDFLRRVPAARIGGGKDLYIDVNGYLFDQPEPAGPPDLPLITGMERKIAHARLGKATALKEVEFSLQVINGLRQDKALSAYRLRTIDVSIPDNLVFVFLPADPQGLAVPGKAEREAIEVRLGEGNIPAKIQLLSTVLSQMRSSAANIKYIDLRFREPVIKFKNMEKFAKTAKLKGWRPDFDEEIYLFPGYRLKQDRRMLRGA